jgi:hypothetical protein
MGESRAESSSPKTNNRLVKGLFGFEFMLLSGLGLFFFGWDSFCFSLVAFAVSWTLISQAITSVEVKPDALVGKNKQDSTTESIGIFFGALTGAVLGGLILLIMAMVFVYIVFGSH